MNINFKIKEAPEDYKLTSESKVYDIYSLMVKKLNELDLKINNDYQVECEDIKFPKKIDINIIFVNGTDIFNHYFEEEIAQNTYGVFNISNGDGFLGDDSLSKEFSVLVDASYESFKYAYDNYSTDNKVDFISRYLVTLTHEINHALEFIENSGGLTPYQVDEHFDSGTFNYTVNDCCTGYGLPQYFNDFENVFNEEDIYDTMEERVENKGRLMFSKLNISEDNIKSLIPKEKKKSKLKI